MTEWLLLGVGVLLIAANAVFVAAEFSLVTVDRATVQRRADAGDARSAGLLAALRSLSTQLSGAQLGITVTSLVVGLVAEPSLAQLVRGPLGAAGVPDGAVTGVSVTLALVVATVVQMVLGELVPKNWAIAQPLRVGRAVAPVQRGFTAAAGPLIRVLNGSANAVLRLVGVEPTEELASARNPQELSSLVSRSGHAGTLDTDTARLLARSLDFGGRTAGDAMSPRPRACFLAADQPVSEVLASAAGTGHARFPVVGTSVDDVVGLVHFKHALAVPPAERPSRPVRDVMAPVRVVPETMQLDPLLAVLREPGLQMAVVVDEYGGTAGIVTLEDLVEEIVGEIADEQDRPARRARQDPDGTWSLSGLLRPDEAGDLIGVRLPEAAQADTLAGLLIERLGRLPDVGDAVVVQGWDVSGADSDGLPTPAEVTLRVTRLDGHRVDVIGARRLGASAARAAGTARTAGTAADGDVRGERS